MDILNLLFCVMMYTSHVGAELSKKPSIQDESSQKGQRRNSKMSRGFESYTYPNIRHPLYHNAFLNKDQLNDIDEIEDELYPKIVSGRPAMEGEFPWMVALHLNGRFICSSFLISPTVVMTAAHCVIAYEEIQPVTSFYGIVGNVNREGPETRILFTEVYAHPQYGIGSEYDIAILRVDSPLEANDRVSPICIPAPGREIDLVYIQAMGWGVTSSETLEAPEVMMTTELSVPTESICKFLFLFMGITVTDRHICAGAVRPTGVCYGDSGSPAVYDDPNSGRPIAIGVASFITALGCGRPVVPSVYTRISSYIDWLTQTLSDTNDLCFI